MPEGLAAGLPTISTTQTGAAVEFIKTDFNGWLIPQGDEESLYKALKEAITLSNEALNTMAQNARDTVRTHSIAQGAKRFMDAAKNAL